MTIRPARREDAEAIAALHAANWRQGYAGNLPGDYLANEVEADRLTGWQDRLSTSDDGRETLVSLDAAGALAGFACVYHGHDPVHGAFLDNLHASAAHRGQGHGLALFREITRLVAARDPDSGLYLWVFEKNEDARAFYRKLGAREIERTDTQWALAMGEWRLRCRWTAEELNAVAAG